jgi:alkylated DNA nucleotide flippase Atl1
MFGRRGAPSEIASKIPAVKLATLAAALIVCGAAAARNVGQIPANPDPKTSSWFRAAKSPGGTSCCDEADGFREGVAVTLAQGDPAVVFRSWWIASNGYHLSLLDPRDLAPTELVWDGPVVRDNPTSGAVVWLSRENGILVVRCFSPGPQT